MVSPFCQLRRTVRGLLGERQLCAVAKPFGDASSVEKSARWASAVRAPPTRGDDEEPYLVRRRASDDRGRPVREPG